MGREGFEGRGWKAGCGLFVGRLLPSSRKRGQQISSHCPDKSFAGAYFTSTYMLGRRQVTSRAELVSKMTECLCLPIYIR